MVVLSLGERLDWLKVLAVLLGFAGVAIIVRYGGWAIDSGHLIMLAGAMTFGISVVAEKSLTCTESVVRSIFWMLVIQSVIGLIPAMALWQAPPGLSLSRPS
jgi:drug/metabolite transporter (DMT)-like permease